MINVSKYNAWREPLRRIQIRAISLLTALMYFIYAQLDTLVAPPEILHLMTIFHLYVLAPYLFTISLLTFSKKLYKVMLFFHMLGPVMAAVFNLIIIINYDDSTIYLSELYLIIFWIFTISGLPLFHAISSATLVVVLVPIVTIFLYPLEFKIAVMHIFWLLATLSFGILSAYLIERLSKIIFINKEKLEHELHNREKLELELKKFNSNLQHTIKAEVKKSREKDDIIFHQSKLIIMGEMIENIAHQWRQPLSKINSIVLAIYANLGKSDLVLNKLSEIEITTKYMSNTIDDFQSFFDKEKKVEEFNLNDIIDKSISIVYVKKSEISIESNIDKNLIVNGYPRYLQQVIVVIINNAKDALLHKSIENPIIAIDVVEKEEMLTIQICDNAKGIDEKNINRIFEPYFTTKHKSQGRGLGLYISKMIIEDGMNGELLVANSSSGACFTIKIKKE